MNKSKKRPLILTRGAAEGQCNMCGLFGKLTADHLPPQGCRKPTRVEITQVSLLWGQDPNPPKARQSQNGLHYRTLCGSCNNGILGGKCDPSLIAFSKGVASLLLEQAGNVHLDIEIRPQAVMRAAIGHIVAQGLGRFEKGDNTEPVRRYLTDLTERLPDSLGVYVWVYPAQPLVAVHGAGLVRPTGTVVFSVLKFFPLAFAVCWNEPRPDLLLPGMVPLHRWRNAAFDEKAVIALPLGHPIRNDWPERPTDFGFVLHGCDALLVREV